MEAEEVEFGSRQSVGIARWLIPLVAALWSLFQLAVAGPLLLDSVIVRCCHLAFAVSLVFLCFPWRVMHVPLRFWDLMLALLAAGTALYLAIDYEGIAERQGLPLPRDLLVGGLLLVLVLEAARRSLGPALPAVALLMMLLSLFASDLPEFLASRDVSFSHLISKLTLSTEGIYGIPLRVSSDTVFLFVLFGAMLDKAGGGRYFVHLATHLLGGYTGGPAKAAVLASGLTGMVSGSSIANTVTTGTFTIPLMKRCGYPAEKAAAIEVAASTNGQLMPPIMGAAAFIIGEYCNLPYLEVVRAAILPALVSYLALFYITHLEALRLDLKPVVIDERISWSEGLYYFFPLAYLLYSLIYERRSASNSAMGAIFILSLVIVLRSLLAERSLKNGLVTLLEALVAGGRNMMGIGVAVAAAGIIVGVVSMGLGSKITQVIGFLSFGNLYLLLLITAVISLFLGMGLPTTANYIVMANLTVPAILVLAADHDLAVPLIAGHLFCFYFGILADDTPPVGLAAYAAAAIAKSDPIRTGIQGFAYDMRTALLPFAFILNPQFLLIGVDTPSGIVWMFAKAILGMAAFCACSRGWLVMAATPLHRLLLASASALLLFGQQPIYDFAGITLFLAVWLLQQRQKLTSA